MIELNKLFDLEYGDRAFTDKSMLDAGGGMVISSQGMDNGVYGFFDAPLKYKPPIITVPRTGSIGYAFVQQLDCNITDDCIILKPKKKYSIEFLFYITAIIRKIRWKYNYGRKITPKRLSCLSVIEPENYKTSISYNQFLKQLYPPKEASNRWHGEITNIKSFPIVDLFNLERGQFHAIDRLEDGELPTISRISTDNGLVGFYKKPKRAKLYPALTITVSTVTGDAFLQTNAFIATDNVVMLLPKNKFKVSTLLFIVAAINKIKWRYSYGRQPYKRVFQKTTIMLPINKSSKLDEDLINNLITKQPHWNYFDKLFLKGASASCLP